MKSRIEGAVSQQHDVDEWSQKFARIAVAQKYVEQASDEILAWRKQGMKSSSSEHNEYVGEIRELCLLLKDALYGEKGRELTRGLEETFRDKGEETTYVYFLTMLDTFREKYEQFSKEFNAALQATRRESKPHEVSDAEDK